MKKILIVVDYQKDFVDGSLGFEDAKLLDGGICAKIRKYENDEIVYTLDTHDADYLSTREGAFLPVRHCIRGTDGHGLYGRTAELLRGKRSFEKSAFPSLELAKYLEQGNYDVIELCGLVSSICVLSNAVMAKAACPEARIIVDSHLTAAADKNMHNMALEIMRNLQIEII